MRHIRETIEIKHPDTGKVIVSCKVRVILSWYLHPLVFIEEPILLEEMPELFSHQGLFFTGLPHVEQKEWFLGCFFSWNRYKERVLIPAVANLYVRLDTGEWTNGSVAYEMD
jgi:hypothetical protein